MASRRAYAMMACRGDRKPLRLIGARLRSGVTPQHQKQKPDGIKTNNDGVSIPDKAASWEGVRLHHSSRGVPSATGTMAALSVQTQGQRRQRPQPQLALGDEDRVSPDIDATEGLLPPLDADIRRDLGVVIQAEAGKAAEATSKVETSSPGDHGNPGGNLDVHDDRHVDVHVDVGRAPPARCDAAPRTWTDVPAPDFDDTGSSFALFSTWELVRAYLVLRACAIKPLVDHSEVLLRMSYRTFGEKLTNGVLRETFFAHFCAGETAQEVGRRAAKLRAHGVGGILDYAAEVDLRPVEERANLKKEEKENEKDNERRRRSLGGDARFLLEKPPQQEPAQQCRTYDYMGEAECDVRTSTFLECVRAVRDQTPGGFAAVKLSALGDPAMLARLTTCVRVIRGLPQNAGVNQDDGVSQQEFQEACRGLFASEMEEDRATLVHTMEWLLLKDQEKSGSSVDYAEWRSWMRRLDRPRPGISGYSDGSKGPEEALLEAMQRRVRALADGASASGVRLMIDAEQSWLQPAIENNVHGLQREFNRDFPTIFTTHQCYLKDSLEGLSKDLDRAAREGYHWAGKLVRGAYMISERQRAAKEGYDSPVFDTIEETHANYDAAVAMVLEHMARGASRAEVMIATHNQASIERAIALMRDLGISREEGVSFGQLLGMADNITFPLGARGFKAYKYVPYGKVGETIPYLVRRAQENSGVLGGASHERALVAKEISRRVLG
ncbi:unnamed protein product [Ascophyllum nodosum]